MPCFEGGDSTDLRAIELRAVRARILFEESAAVIAWDSAGHGLGRVESTCVGTVPNGVCANARRHRSTATPALDLRRLSRGVSDCRLRASVFDVTLLAFFALLFVYVGLALVNRLLYNVLDVAGFTCTRSAETKGLARGETVTVEFKTSDLCKPTGVYLDGSGARYMVKVEPVPSEPWHDAAINVPFGGFSPTDEPTWNQRILLGLGVPLRRELTRDWFRIVLRYGDVGGEEAFLDPDPTDSVIETPIKPTREGELFIFVNDAVLGIPGLYDLFYRNNKGAAKLTVKRR
jgi:hypothetical protein